jgi:hypothetical protein
MAIDPWMARLWIHARYLVSSWVDSLRFLHHGILACAESHDRYVVYAPDNADPRARGGLPVWKKNTKKT